MTQLTNAQCLKSTQKQYHFTTLARSFLYEKSLKHFQLKARAKLKFIKHENWKNWKNAKMSQNGINVARFARKYETSWTIFTQCEHVLKHVRTCLSIVLKPYLETKFVKTISFQECATFLEAWNSYILTPFFTEKKHSIRIEILA